MASVGRTGNELYVAEGNAYNSRTKKSNVVSVGNGTWHIVGNTLVRNTPGSIYEIIYQIKQAYHHN